MNGTDPDSRAGSRFGPYLLEQRLGTDDISEVYAASDVRNKNPVAIKLITGLSSEPRRFIDEIERELADLVEVHDKHVIPVHAVGEIDGLAYLEMPLVDGDSLAALLADGPLSPPRAVAIVQQIATALDAAHNAGVAHRDVTPGNILVTEDDTAYLVGFGVRAAADGGIPAGAPGAQAHVRARRGDDFALAAVLAHCLTGIAPCQRESMEQAATGRIAVTPPRPSRLRPGRVTVALDSVLARGLAKTPADRYRSASEFASAAAEALSEPERHQLARIQRRGERGKGGRTFGPSVWDITEPEQRFALGLVRNPDFGPAPLQLPAESNRRLARKPVRAVIAAAAAVLVLAAIAGVGRVISQSSVESSVAAPPQSVLQISHVDYRLTPNGLAIDSNGTVYISSEGTPGRVLRLPAGSEEQSLVPFSDLYEPRRVTVDADDNVYFSDANNMVIKISAGSGEQTVLPFQGLNDPTGVAVDAGGNVYTADSGNNRILKLTVATNEQTVLPFFRLDSPDGIAVDDVGNVYVTDTGNSRVVKLVTDAAEPIVVPLTGIASPRGLAIDGDGALYIAQGRQNKVVKLPAGGSIPVVLPFTGLDGAVDVAISRHGGAAEVYVADRGNGRVVKVNG